MSNTPNRKRRPWLLALALACPVLWATGHALPGHAGTAARVLLVSALVVLLARAIWWLAVDGRVPDIAQVMSGRHVRR